MVVGIEKLHSGGVVGKAEVILASNSAGNRLNWREISISLKMPLSSPNLRIYKDGKKARLETAPRTR